MIPEKIGHADIQGNVDIGEGVIRRSTNSIFG